MRSSVQFSRSVTSNSLWPRGLQHTRLPCPSPTWSLLKLMSIESVMPSNHLILCYSLLLLPPIPSSIRVFSNMPANLENSAVAGKSHFSFQSQRKVMRKNAQITAQLHLFHTLAKKCSKLSKPGFNSTWTVNLQMFKLNLDRGTPVFLPGKSDGWKSLVGFSPWGREESDTTERLHFHFSFSCIGEGNGNPLQCSCLENPRDGGTWWAAVFGVAQTEDTTEAT